MTKKMIIVQTNHPIDIVLVSPSRLVEHGIQAETIGSI